MSRHHIHLLPITYVPLPKPKKIRKQRRRVEILSNNSIEDIDDASPIENTIGLAPPPSAASPSEFSSIEGLEHGPKQQSGLLSEGTLKTMLLIQEKFT